MTKTSDKDKICLQVKKTCIREKGVQSWNTVRRQIYSDMSILQPGMPKDGIPGYLAYNIRNKPQRMKMRTGKFLGKQLRLNHNYLSPAILEYLAGKVNMAIFGMEDSDNMTFLVGGAIEDAYENCVGSGSCMAGSDHHKVGLYCMNPTRFQLAVMKLGMNSGRALLSKLDNGSFFMDRIYYDSVSLQEAMTDYAVKQGWYYRNSDSSCSLNRHQLSRKDACDILHVSDLEWEDGRVPYMDTLVSGNINNQGKLDISANNGDIELCSCSGYIEAGGYTCDDCDDHYPDEDSVFFCAGRAVCRSCYYENYFTCDYCGNIRDNNELNEIVDMGISVCDNCTADYGVCDDCDDHVLDRHYMENLDQTVCRACAVEYTQCDNCRNWAKNEDIDENNECPECPDRDPDDDNDEDDPEPPKPTDGAEVEKEVEKEVETDAGWLFYGGKFRGFPIPDRRRPE